MPPLDRVCNLAQYLQDRHGNLTIFQHKIYPPGITQPRLRDDFDKISCIPPDKDGLWFEIQNGPYPNVASLNLSCFAGGDTTVSNTIKIKHWLQDGGDCFSMGMIWPIWDDDDLNCSGVTWCYDYNYTNAPIYAGCGSGISSEVFSGNLHYVQFYDYLFDDEYYDDDYYSRRQLMSQEVKKLPEFPKKMEAAPISKKAVQEVIPKKLRALKRGAKHGRRLTSYAETCETVEYCDHSNVQTHSWSFAPIHALGALMVWLPVAGFGMLVGLLTKFYMFVANPMPTCCASKQGWKCGAVQQIVGFCLYFVALIMLMAGHGQINEVITSQCDDCSQEDEDNFLNIINSMFTALYALVLPVAIFALLNSIMLCIAKDAWGDPQEAATDPAVGMAPMAPQALQYAPQMVQIRTVKVQEMVPAEAESSL